MMLPGTMATNVTFHLFARFRNRSPLSGTGMSCGIRPQPLRPGRPAAQRRRGTAP